MYRVLTNIVIQQIPSADWPNRKQKLGFNFCHSYEASSSWRDLTNNGKLIIPKNLYFKDEFGVSRPLFGTNVNVGGFSSSAPLVLRGDAVTIAAGYKYFESKNADRETTKIATLFTGYVSKVSSGIPIELEIEDSMWLFKQTPIDVKTFSSTDTLESVLKHLVDKVNAQWGTNLTVNPITSTTFDAFVIGNESACHVLSRLQKKYGFEFYFRGNELRGGTLIYIESEAKTQNFTFQNNIIEDDLQYVRKDDVKLSTLAHNTLTEATGTLTKDGKQKSRRKRLEVLVTMKTNPSPNELPYTFKQINSGDVVPESDDGEQHAYFGLGCTTIESLAAHAYNQLKKYYYTGLRGSFTTFGLPFVQFGDNAAISDPKLPERNGVYTIKKVEYTGGVEGLRQKVELDYKLP